MALDQGLRASRGHLCCSRAGSPARGRECRAWLLGNPTVWGPGARAFLRAHRDEYAGFSLAGTHVAPGDVPKVAEDLQTEGWFVDTAPSQVVRKQGGDLDAFVAPVAPLSVGAVGRLGRDRAQWPKVRGTPCVVPVPTWRLPA